jgi:signal transduction histidine kinase
MIAAEVPEPVMASRSAQVDERQSAYGRFLRAQLVSRTRIGGILCAILIPFGVVLDIATHPHLVLELLWVRLGFGAGCVALVAVTTWKGVARFALGLSVTLALWSSLCIEVLVVATGASDSAYYAGLNLIVLGMGLLYPWTRTQMLAVCAAIYLLYLLPVFVLVERPPHWADFFNNNYFLLLTGVIAVTSSHFSARLREREFFARTELEERTEELKETSAQLQSSLKKLQELDHLKSQFFANVSHELRTPLTLILSPIEAMLQDDEQALPPPVRESLGSMHRNAARLLLLINNLLDLAKLEAGKVYLRYEPIELCGFLAGLLPPFSALAQRKRIRFALEGGEAEPVHADPERLDIVFQNLLANALKFTPEGGSVTVRVSQEPSAVAAEVSDTGIGIAPKDLPVIFDRFAQADGTATRRFGGTGIGLALVKELVELHGGAVSVRSEPDRGSTFTVRLPRGTAHIREDLRERRAVDLPVLRDRRESNRDPVASLMPRAAPADVIDWAEPLAEAEAEPTGRPHILFVEDNPDLRRFVAGLLRQEYRVTLAVDGEEGLEKARSLRPDLVLSDVMMPRLSGYDLTRALKADPKTAVIPIVLLTAKRGAEPTIEGFAQGADDYLGKPFNTRELLARIRAQLRLRDLSRQLAQAQKTAMLGTLAAGLAHEVRNPVNCILNSLPVVRRAVESAPGANGRAAAASELLDIIAEGAERIDGIVRDLLAFTHLDQAEVKSWDPTAGIESTIQLLRHRLQGLVVHRDLEFQGSVEGRPGQLNQVLMNLLDNAVRAVGPRGQIWVRTERDGAGVRITIRDDGPGIAPEILPRIFDPFFTTREVGEGTGLGLHITRQIVEAHGGRIRADTVPGQGALFTLWLPEQPASEQRDESRV